MNIPTYGYGEAVTNGLIDLQISLEQGRMTPVGLVAAVRQEPEYQLPIWLIDETARELFPDKDRPHWFTPEAQAAAGGMIVALYLAELMGAEPARLRSILANRLDTEGTRTLYPNGAREFMDIGSETLEDLAVLPQAIPAGEMARTDGQALYFRAGFGFVLSAALEEYSLR